MTNYVLATLLIIFWVLGLAYFNAGAIVHVLLFIAMITVAGNQKKRRVRRRIRAYN